MPDKQFVDRQARVRIDLPSGWVLLKRDNPLIPPADSKEAKMVALHQGSGCLAMLFVMDNITSQNYFDEFLANLKSEGRKNETNATELERHSVTFGGIGGRRAKLTVTDKSGSTSILYITGAPNNKRFYFLTGEVESHYAEDGLRAFIDLEKSFSIIISDAGSK